MKKLTAFLVMSLTGLALVAGELNWETNFEKAKDMAKKDNKQILINFTGSDWCGWCKRLDREVFRKDDFAKFAEKELVLLKVDFPRYTKQDPAQRKANEKLASSFGVMGFPTIYLVDADGDILLRTGYQRGGVDNYIKHLQAKLK